MTSILTFGSRLLTSAWENRLKILDSHLVTLADLLRLLAF